MVRQAVRQAHGPEQGRRAISKFQVPKTPIPLLSIRAGFFNPQISQITQIIYECGVENTKSAGFNSPQLATGKFIVVLKIDFSANYRLRICPS
jgi:hypothetical protein